MIEALERPHLAPYDFRILFDPLLRHGLQYDLACGIHWCHQSGEIARGVEGERRGGAKVGLVVRGGADGWAGWRSTATVHCSGASGTWDVATWDMTMRPEVL